MPICDRFIERFDRALRAILAVPVGASSISDLPEDIDGQNSPGAASHSGHAMSDQERRHSAGLMRVNHVGEVCAQALYHGQAAATANGELRQKYRAMADEEGRHLAWTAQRLAELHTRPSLLNPFWYGGAFALGWLAGRAGDSTSLGFVVETERQVEQHLDDHLRTLPDADLRSRAIVECMRQDEIRHGATAQSLGAVELPLPLRTAMRVMAKVMTTTAYRI